MALLSKASSPFLSFLYPIKLFIPQNLLSAYYRLNSILDPGDTLVNKTQFLFLWVFIIIYGNQTAKWLSASFRVLENKCYGKKVKQGKRVWECREVRVGCNEKVTFKPKHSILSKTNPFALKGISGRGWAIVNAPREQVPGFCSLLVVSL